MWSGIDNMWQGCFPSSASFSYTCETCGIYRIPVSMIQVNHKLLWDNGFNKLQESITLIDSQVQCIKCRREIASRSLLFNRCICIELEIRMYQKSPMKCQLEEIPTIIHLNNKPYQ